MKTSERLVALRTQKGSFPDCSLYWLTFLLEEKRSDLRQLLNCINHNKMLENRSLNTRMHRSIILIRVDFSMYCVWAFYNWKRCIMWYVNESRKCNCSDRGFNRWISRFSLFWHGTIHWNVALTNVFYTVYM